MNRGRPRANQHSRLGRGRTVSPSRLPNPVQQLMINRRRTVITGQ